MTDHPHHAPTWTSDRPGAVGTRLVRVPPAALDALAVGDLARAQTVMDAETPPGTRTRQRGQDTRVTLTEFLVGEGCRSVWARRSRQVADAPADADWVTRLVVAPSGEVVGRAGFHGAPDDGTVEVGYETDPAHRRRGSARAALRILLDVAHGEPDVHTLRASVRPDNVASRTLVEQHGLVVTGEQWDDEDGLETIFEIDVRVARAG